MKIGYVVVKYNQVSKQPGLPVGADVHWDRDTAQDVLDGLAEETASVGRGETYEIAVLVPVGEWE